jgi:hypothetical protein
MHTSILTCFNMNLIERFMYVRFEVIMAVATKINVFWYVLRCSLIHFDVSK